MKAAGYDLAKLRSVAPAAAAAGGAFGGFGFRPGAGLFGAAAAASDSDHDSSEHSGSGSEASEWEAPPAGPPCFHCGTGSWQTLGAAVEHIAGVGGGPRATTEFVKQALYGNDFERGILEEWLATQSRGLGEAIARVLVGPNPAGARPVRVELGGAGGGGKGGGKGDKGKGKGDKGKGKAAIIAMPEGPWTDLNACRGCGTSVLRAVVYSLRERIPDAELCERGRGRGVCWYGRGCRTQAHNPDHARKLNHICEQTRFH